MGFRRESVSNKMVRILFIIRPIYIKSIKVNGKCTNSYDIVILIHMVKDL